MDESTENKQTIEMPAEGQPDEVAAALRAELAAKSSRLDEVTRAYAELLNDRDAFRQRLERDKERQMEGAKAEVATGLFDALDDLRRALAAEQSTQGLVEGVQMIADGLQKRVEAMGLTPIPTVNHPFDPNLHEAVDLALVGSSEQDGMVIEEVRAGWCVGNRVVRAARVRVGRFLAQGES